MYAEGVECFVFNRTPAYDAIVERMKKHEKEDQDTGPRTSDETLAKQKSNGTTGTGIGEEGASFGARLRKVAKSATSGTSQTQETVSSSGVYTVSRALCVTHRQTPIRSPGPIHTRCLFSPNRSKCPLCQE